MSEIGTGLQNATGIRDSVARAGYAFVEASDMRTALSRFGALSDWPAFAESWNDLHLDTYMADGGRYRRRRYAVGAEHTASRPDDLHPRWKQQAEGGVDPDRHHGRTLHAGSGRRPEAG